MQVMFIDDERIIREGLKTMIAWDELGFDRLTEARSAQLALEQFDRDPPDLIITDIVMPEMTGIEFVRRVRQKEKDTHIIILTGYEKFEYAREAIQLDVAKYLVKPVYPHELYEVVNDVVVSIRQRSMESEWKAEVNHRLREYRTREQEAFWLDVIQGKIKDTANIEKRMAELDIEPLDLPRICVMIQLDRGEAIARFGDPYLSLIQYAIRNIAEELTAGRQCMFVNMEPPNLLGICAPAGMTGVFQHIVKSIDELLGISCYLGVGRPATQWNELERSAVEAREAADAIALFGERGIYAYDQLDIRPQAYYPYDAERQLMQSLTMNPAKLRQEVQAFVDLIHEQQMTSLERRMCYVQLLSAIYRLMDEWEITEQMTSFKKEFQYLMTANLEHEIVDMFEKLLVQAAECRRKQQAGHAEQLVWNAKYLIEQQFADSGLSVSGLAEKLGITPNYLSRLFQRITSQTVSEYMTMVRLNAACELLKQTSLRVFDIAEQVGYTNGHYFSMVFKKRIGMTPGAYRDKDKDDE